MKKTAPWIAFSLVVIVLYVTDIKHLPTSNYNLFLTILLGMVSGLVLFLKVCHRRTEPDEADGSNLP